MKYIKKITLENFQSHKYSVIELNESLNVIVGPSDSGKSAIIRGIKWALYNEPAGDYFIREGESDCSVTLEFNDNTILKRYRSKSKNSYSFLNKNGIELKFEGFGSNIPAEIVDSIGIKKIYLDSNESNSINLGEQLDGAFLLSEKTSTRASAIGRLVGVNIIDDALREVLKDTRGLNTHKKNLDESTTQLGIELSSYDHLDDLKIRLKKVTDIKSSIKDNQNKLEKVILLKSKLNEVSKEVYESTQIIQKLKVLDRLNELINIVDNKALKYKYLNNYNANLIKVNHGIKDNVIIFNKLININYAYDMILKLEEINLRYYKLNILQKKHILRINEKSKLDELLGKLDKIGNIENDFNEITRKYSQLNKLEHYNLKYKSNTDSINNGKRYIQKLSGVDKIEMYEKQISAKTDLLIKLNNIYDIILTIRSDKEKQLDSLLLYNSTIQKQLEDYQDLLREIEICPFCLSNIDEHKIEHIINHYIGG